MKRDGIDLNRLPVAQIANAYLDYVRQMRELNLSVAGDYLVMASTLIHLKSLDLLPRLPTPVEEDEPDPRAAFAERLREYQRYKDASELLDQRPLLGRDTFARPSEEQTPGELETSFDIFGLLDLYRGMLQVAAEPEPEVRFLVDPGLDLGDAVTNLLVTLHESGGRGELRALLHTLSSRAARVITFIGVLEMLRLGWVSIEQRVHLGEIEITALVTPENADRRALSGWVETHA